MRRLVYSEAYFNSSDGNLGWISAAITAGASIFGGLFGGGGGGQAYRGLAGINQAGQEAIGSLQQILQAVSAGQMPKAQAVSEAQRIASILSDHSVVYQAKKGQDAAALQNFKAQAAQLVQQIQAAPDVSSGGSTTGGGVSSGTLLLVGGGLLAVALLKK